MERLTPELVVAAYARGYFPMADPDSGSIEWFQPPRRAVFLPGDAHCSRSLRRIVRQKRFEVRLNSDFGAVVRHCAARDETWISDDIVEVYRQLHSYGLAHSVEAYADGALAGGLYGVALGGAFFGESMFHLRTDASKVAFAALVDRLEQRGFLLHDAQFMTPHLATLGAREVSGAEYLRLLRQALTRRCHLG